MVVIQCSHARTVSIVRYILRHLGCGIEYEFYNCHRNGRCVCIVSEEFSVEISRKGRGGPLVYRDGFGTIEMYWEFAGAAGVVATVSCGCSAKGWGEKYPWAKNRIRIVLTRVANEIITQKTPGCTYEINEYQPSIKILNATTGE